MSTTVKCEDNSESEEYSNTDLMEKFTGMFEKWQKTKTMNGKLTKERDHLTAKVKILEAALADINGQTMATVARKTATYEELLTKERNNPATTKLELAY